MTEHQVLIITWWENFFESLAKLVAFERDNNFMEFKLTWVYFVVYQEISVLLIRVALVHNFHQVSLLSDIQSELLWFAYNFLGRRGNLNSNKGLIVSYWPPSLYNVEIVKLLI